MSRHCCCTVARMPYLSVRKINSCGHCGKIYFWFLHFQEVASSRRSSISNEDARSVLHGLISLVSEISRLSVQQAVVGQVLPHAVRTSVQAFMFRSVLILVDWTGPVIFNWIICTANPVKTPQAPVIIEMATFLVNTSLLNLDAFSADYEAETELGVHASLPTDLFNDDNLKPPKISSRTLEVMHAVFSQEANPLQLANGPILILEPRDRFKGESIGFYDFDTPVKLKMPFTSTLQVKPGEILLCVNLVSSVYGAPPLLCIWRDQRGYIIVVRLCTWRFSA